MENTNDISIIEYIYQLNVSKFIKNNQQKNKKLVTEVEKMIKRKEERLERLERICK